jgi:hypothetical protein
VNEKPRRSAPLGSRVVARFRRVGLDKRITELRGQPAQPADFELIDPWSA